MLRNAGKVLLVLVILCVGAASAQAMELVLWGHSSFTPSTPDAVRIIYQELYEQYQAENPEVDFTYDVLPGGNQALQKILAAASVDELPDLCTVDNFWMPRLVERGIVQPLNDWWPEEDRADFQREAIETLTFDGSIYGVQWQNAWRGLFYRSDILEEIGYSAPPTNFDEFVEMGLKLKDKGYWAVMLPGMNTEVTFLHMLGMFWGFGGQLVDEIGRPVFHKGKNREALRKTYQIYYDLVNVHELMPKDIMTMDEGAIRQYLYSGEAAIVAQSSSHMMNIRRERPDLYDVLGTSKYPMPEGYSSVAMFGGWTYAIFTPDPVKQEAAWKFINMITAPETMGRLNEAHGNLPVRASIYNKSSFFKEDPIYSQFYDLAFRGETQARPPVPIYPTISNQLTLVLADVIEGVDIDEAIDEAADEVMAEWNRMQR